MKKWECLIGNHYTSLKLFHYSGLTKTLLYYYNIYPPTNLKYIIVQPLTDVSYLLATPISQVSLTIANVMLPVEREKIAVKTLMTLAVSTGCV